MDSPCAGGRISRHGSRPAGSWTSSGAVLTGHGFHEQTFTESDGGTLARDVVPYAVPGGALINWLFVRRDVERIFAFRRARLRERFG